MPIARSRTTASPTSSTRAGSWNKLDTGKWARAGASTRRTWKPYLQARAPGRVRRRRCARARAVISFARTQPYRAREPQPARWTSTRRPLNRRRFAANNLWSSSRFNSRKGFPAPQASRGKSSRNLVYFGAGPAFDYRQVSDRAGFRRASRWRRAGCGLPLPPTASAPRSGSWISRLNTRPARSLVNASSVRLPAQTHDSGSLRFARPSTFRTCIYCTAPV
jgi:hypothetical protein